MASNVTVLFIILTSYRPLISYLTRNPEEKGPDYASIEGYILFGVLALLNALFLDPKWDKNGIPIEGRFVRSSHHKKSHLIGAILYSKCDMTPLTPLIMLASRNVLSRDPIIAWTFFINTLIFVVFMLTDILVDCVQKYNQLTLFQAITRHQTKGTITCRSSTHNEAHMTTQIPVQKFDLV